MARLLSGTEDCPNCLSKDITQLLQDNLRLKRKIENMRRWLRNIPEDWMAGEDGEHLPEEERQGELQHNLEHPGGLQDHDTRGFIEDPVAGTVEELEQDNADEHQENIDEQGALEHEQEALEHEQGALEHEEEEVMIEEEPDLLVQIKTEIVSQEMDEEGIVQEDYEDYFMQQSYGELKDAATYSNVKNRFKCDECDYCTPYKCNLKKHKASTHQGIRHPCDQCDYSATQSGHLRTHKKRKHRELFL